MGQKGVKSQTQGQVNVVFLIKSDCERVALQALSSWCQGFCFNVILVSLVY